MVVVKFVLAISCSSFSKMVCISSSPSAIERSHLTSSGKLRNDVAIAPRIYGLPKIHKEGYPLRPICSSINAPSSQLCKFVVNILKNIIQNSKYNIRDSVQFRNKIKDLTTEEDEKIVSFDVISLFPSIPVELALTIIEQRWDEIKEFTKMTQNTFLRILKFCIMENRYFQFEEKIYKQKKGLPMGSPASPIVADIVMEKLLMDCENKLTTKPKILLKYVDDLFAVTHKNAIMNMLNTLNNFHSNIKFTVEEEDNGQLPYLDTLVIRKNGKLNLDWYQKPTASGRIINFYSKHPKRIIINTANNLIHRVLTISDKEFHAKNKERIKQILAKNNFPKYLANNLINSKKNNKEFDEHQTKTKSYKSLTYIPNVSERIENSNIFDKEKFTIAHKTNNTLKELFTNPKTKLPNMEKHNLVYEIKCDGNDQQSCEKVYVGTTGNKLKTRIAGHKSDYKLRGNNIIQKTALANHCATQKHIPNFDNVRILARESNYNKRFTQEMLHIINTPSEKRINYKADIEGNAKSYRQLIEKRKNMKRTQKTHRRKHVHPNEDAIQVRQSSCSCQIFSCGERVLKKRLIALQFLSSCTIFWTIFLGETCQISSSRSGRRSSHRLHLQNLCSKSSVISSSS
ncbi:uncharacterized protein LOC142239619 [Haematobia irritans]|uniref:uncharacterized protein LOC142239619 n=1 Tax=Haematobia irritans TaxID=7368 RepID=UPI003F5078E0